MRRFGEYRDLSELIVLQIEAIINAISELNIEDLSIYYGYPLIELDRQQSIMKGCIISRNGIIALYEDDIEKIVYERHFTQLIMQSPKLSTMYFNGKKILSCVCINRVEEIINILHQEILFSHEDYKQINGIIQNIYGMNKIDEREVRNETTLGAIIKKRNNAMNMLDQNQFNGIYNKISNHARIRGLAGSGKTILLVKKMAYTHFKYPELELAYIFYTKSLKQYIRDLFVLYYKDFEKYKQPNMKKIHILHSWGGNEMTGFYSKVCEDNSLKYRSWMQAKSLKGIDKYDAVCKEVLDITKGNINKTYDYVFVDEAQDFNIYFFKLALKTLKYTGKLIYAYDELQSLNSVNPMPSKNMIFSKEECEDINLSVCYRTPKEILVTAHALGLGIYKKKKDGSPDIVNMMEDYSIWKAVGYKEKEGILGYGKHVVLQRDEAIEYKPEECVDITTVNDRKEQYEKVVKEIVRLVEKEDVVLEDILIIDLASMSLKDDFSELKKEFICQTEGSAINYRIHLVDKDNAINFKRNESITFTTIFRAKGNEANIVFVLNAHKISSMITCSRNRLFTALTRAKFKAYVYGVDGDVMKSLRDEYEEVKTKKYELDFIYPTSEVLKEIQNIAKVESEKYDTFQKVYKDVGDNTDVTIEILKEQIGANSIEELIRELQKYNNEQN